MPLTLLRFLAVLSTALSLVPAGAHLFALPNKIGLGEAHYFIVQQIYAGWALLGAALFAAVLFNGWLAYAERRRTVPFWLALCAAMGMAATLIIFFIWVFPANQDTGNWMHAPPDWHRLRRDWEYGHAVNAVLTFISFALAVIATIWRTNTRKE